MTASLLRTTLTSLLRTTPTHLCPHLLGLSVSDLQSPGLVVGTVGAGDQLPKGPGAREPRLQVQLLGCCIVQFAYVYVEGRGGEGRGGEGRGGEGERRGEGREGKGRRGEQKGWEGRE